MRSVLPLLVTSLVAAGLLLPAVEDAREPEPFRTARTATAGACPLRPAGTAQPNEGPTDPTFYLRGRGTPRAMMIFVDFEDAPADESALSLHQQLAPRTSAWLDDVSGGRLALDVRRNLTWFRMPQPSDAYGFADGVSYAEQRQYIADAVAASDASIDYSRVRILYIVSSAGADVPISPAFAVGSGFGVAADGNEIRHAVTFGNDIRFPRKHYGANVMIHETGHLFGLPDLYRFGVAAPANVAAAGGWDIMSWVAPGAPFMAWHQHKLGWLTKQEVVCFRRGDRGRVRVVPLEGGQRGVRLVQLVAGRSTSYVAEVRTPVGSDRTICDGGLLVSWVDASQPSGKRPVVVRSAGIGGDDVQAQRCGPKYDAPYDLGQGERAVFRDRQRGVTIRIRAVSSGGYDLQVVNG
jgi:M6 family metalloprotease-like protein